MPALRGLGGSYSTLVEVLLESGQPAAAQQSAAELGQIRKKAVDLAPSDPAAAVELGESLVVLARLNQALGDSAKAKVAYAAALDLFELCAAPNPGNRTLQRDLVAALEGLGGLQQDAGDLAGAGERLGRALAISEQLVESDETDMNALLSVYRNSMALCTVFEKKARKSRPGRTWCGWSRAAKRWSPAFLPTPPF